MENKGIKIKVRSEDDSKKDSKTKPTNSSENFSSPVEGVSGMREKSPKWHIVCSIVIIILIITTTAAIIVINNNSNNQKIEPRASETETSSVESTPGTTSGEPTITTSDGSELKEGTASVAIGNTTVNYSSAFLIDGIEATISGGTFSSASDNQNVFLVVNGGKLTIENASIEKSSSDSFEGRGDDYSFYGKNSAVVVVGEGSEVTLNNVVISTMSSGSNAVVATNSGTATVNNSEISTESDNSRGLHATYGGVINSDSTKISTKGGSCASLATDRGEGTVSASNMTLSTEGAGSPLIYSTGNITVKNSTGTASGAQIAVVEGKNQIAIEDSTLSATGVGNRNNVDNAGVMIYQSMSGDADEGVGSFTAKNSNFEVLSDSSVFSSTPFFFVTNTTASIDLKNVNIAFSPSESFIVAEGTSEWGRSGRNGGVVTYSGTGVTSTNLDVSSDSISSVSGL